MTAALSPSPESIELAALLAQPARRSLVEIPVGIHLDLPEHVYHQRERGVASRTALDQFDHSPLSYLTWVEAPAEDESTPALLFGRAFHCAALEPHRFVRDYIVEPVFGNCTLKANKAARDAWRKDNGHEVHARTGTVLSVDDAKTIAGMVKALHDHPFVGAMLSLDGHREATARWDDAETGVACKARADFWIPELGTLVDLKSCLDARPSAFKRDCAQYGYFRQDPFYRAGWNACGAPVTDFVFVCVEKAAPYLVGVYQLSDTAFAMGEGQNRNRLRRFSECLAANEWPGLSPALETISLPGWVTP